MKYIVLMLACISCPVYSVELRTYTDQRDDRVVKQELDYTCGAASLATILNEYYSHEVSEQDILTAIDIDNKLSLSFLDLTRYAESIRYTAYGYQLDFSRMKQVLHETGAPLLAYVKIKNQDHFLVIRDIDETGNVYVADPSTGNATYKHHDFIRIWQQFSQEGRILVIIPNEVIDIDASFTRNYFPSSIENFVHDPLYRTRKQ